jgi:hypothetical protein
MKKQLNKTIVTESLNQTCLITCISNAMANYHHAEIVVQQRLYNFLMAASILLLAAAATLSVQATVPRNIFIITDSILGFIISIIYTILGYRQRKFIDLDMKIIENLENQLTVKQYCVWEPIAQLAAGKEVTFPISGKKVRLSRLELIMRASNILFIAPFFFALVFLVLFGIVII